MLKNKAFWFGLALLAAYLLLGYVAGPRLVQPRLEQYVSSQLGRELRFERLRVDPLTWSVRLDAVELVAGGQSLWPGLSISTDRVELRFSFWRLSPVVSELTLQTPGLVVDDTNAQLRAGRYPFVGLWQQWQERAKTAAAQQPVPIKSWHVEDGQVRIRQVGSPPAGEILLDNISLQADPQDPGGSRKYTLAFSGAGNVNIKSQGLFSSENLSATGEYQLQMPPATDGRTAELQAAGRFSGDFLADAVRIYLSESQLHSDRVATCMLEGLLCGAAEPLDVGFASSLLAASDGFRLLQINAQVSPFQLDTSLGQDRVKFADQQNFASAQIQLVLPLAESLDSTNQGPSRNFVIQLNAAGNDQYQIDGQLDLVSHTVDARFQVNGRQDISGSTQLRRVGQQSAQAAYSRLDLQLKNPGASLAQEFMDQNFTAALAAGTLQLQLAASVDDRGLRLQKHIILEQTGLVPNAGLDSNPASAPRSGTTLDARWLLALLQGQDDLIKIELPELTVDSTTGTTFRELVQQQTLAMLRQLAEQPFAGLAKALNVSNENLHQIHFAPGSAALDGASTETLVELAGILIQRPGLGVAVAGVYNPLIDKRALQVEQLRTHIALAMAADLAFRTGAEPPDFSDPIVHSVIDEFARRRVPPEVMQEFARQFGHADADQGVLPEGDVTEYYSSLFDLLVDYAEIPQGAMTTLARYRAQAVMDGLEDAGVLRERLEAAAQATSSETPAAAIPLPLQLKVWPDENANSNTGSTESLPPASQTDLQF